MALMRSGQKGLDEIQRIRVAMEGGNPVLMEAQKELIKKKRSPSRRGWGCHHPGHPGGG
jgi:hypothetical protein